MNRLVVHRRTDQRIDTARGTDIDGYLPEDLVDVLYEKWQASWPTPLEFAGGIKSVTCEMVLEVPKGELFKTFGPRNGKMIYDVALRNGS